MSSKSKQKSWHPAGRGFSITELLVGTSIFTVAFLMVLGILPTAFQSLSVSKDYILATQLAGEKLEEISARSFYQIDRTYSDHTTEGTAEVFTLTGRANGLQQDLSFSYYYTITPVPTLDASMQVRRDLYDVQVNVFWERKVYASNEKPGKIDRMRRYVRMATRVPNIYK